MNRRQLLRLIPGLMLAPGLAHGFKIGGLLDAAKDATGALMLSDDDVRAYAAQMAAHMDSQAEVAPPDNPYAQRLAKLTKGLEQDNGLSLNYAVYLTEDINAFAMADGTIRFFSGLMDIMTDDEIRYVIGHEIGHVHAGHSKKRMQTALATSATQKAVAASGSRVAQLADSELGDLIAQVVMAQHSQSNEREADDYALAFMGRYKFDRYAAVTALEKLDKISGGGGWLSTHPSPRERAQRMKAQLS